MSNTLYYETALAHHGIKGQKWGVRRYQNKDGSRTAAGKVRSKKSKEEKIAIGKKVVTGLAATMSVAAAAYYVHKNPQKIGNVVAKFRGVNFKDLKDTTVAKGKKQLKTMLSGAKEGAKEALAEAPKKAAKAVVTGVILNGVKKAMDASIGKEESAKIFQANDNKKIGKFWNR